MMDYLMFLDLAKFRDELTGGALLAVPKIAGSSVHTSIASRSYSQFIGKKRREERTSWDTGSG
jgi:hypothetical protein